MTDLVADLPYLITRVVKIDGVWWAFGTCEVGAFDAHSMSQGLAVSAVTQKMREIMTVHYQQQLVDLWRGK